MVEYQTRDEGSLMMKETLRCLLDRTVIDSTIKCKGDPLKNKTSWRYLLKMWKIGLTRLSISSIFIFTVGQKDIYTHLIFPAIISCNKVGHWCSMYLFSRTLLYMEITGIIYHAKIIWEKRQFRSEDSICTLMFGAETKHFFILTPCIIVVQCVDRCCSHYSEHLWIERGKMYQRSWSTNV